MSKILVLGLVIMFAFTGTSSAQLIYKYKLGAGISTMKILGDNPATKPILELNVRDTNKIVFGGSFNATAPGLAIKLTLEPTEDGDHRIPIDLDWTIYASGERIPISAFWVINYWHSVQNVSFGTGYQYAFYKLPWAKAKLYAGVDVRSNFLFNSELTYKDKWKNLPEKDTSYVINRKSNAVRLGGFARLGLEGDLLKNWSINTSIALGTMNLIGRDNDRRELLTPLTTFETKEQFVNLFNLSLMLQYTFK